MPRTNATPSDWHSNWSGSTLKNLQDMEDVKNTSIDGKERDRWLIVGSILTAAGGAILTFFGVGRN